MKKNKIYNLFFKRLLDLILSLSAIILLSPLFIVIALLIRFNMGRPVIFNQKRPGLNAEIFTMYKFRTMTNEKDQNGKLLPDSERLTKFGKWLRFTSLDELPELFNILKGDMSIIGPRPLLVRYLPYYTDEEKKRHNIRPGLTGISQISGRNKLDWTERLKLDVHYVNNVTFLLDLTILFKTISTVFKRDGITVVDKDSLKDLDEERSKVI